MVESNGCSVELTSANQFPSRNSAQSSFLPLSLLRLFAHSAQLLTRLTSTSMTMMTTEYDVDDEAHLRDNSYIDEEDRDGSEGAAAEGSYDNGALRSDAGSEVDVDRSESRPPQLTVGGSLLHEGAGAAYCLLDGFLLDDIVDERNLQVKERAQVPLRHFPCVLGRAHTTPDPRFYGVPTARALSRQHVRIDYRTTHGILKSILNPSDEEEFEPQVFDEDKNEEDENFKVCALEDIKNYEQIPDPDLGFYTITVLGKNGITVNKQRANRGETMYLPPKAALRISLYAWYFLVPEMPGLEQVLKLPASANKRKLETKTSDNESLSISGGGPPLKKKKKVPAGSTVVTSRGVSHTSAGGWPALQLELDQMSVDQLMEQLRKGSAVDDQGNDNDQEGVGSWDRKQQFIGSTMSYRAVLATAQAPEMQALARANHGVSRSEIMNWIAKSAKFGEWKDLMLQNLEFKSYQASITKALVRAKYTRTGANGRYIKWILPPAIPTNEDEGPDGNNAESEHDDQESNEEAGSDNDVEDDIE
jgi:hypothetical protein